ncbi:MAG: hypothetical protein HY026_04940 [Deltaproteobacteria bacterium]|nr:hypothetical protein [Deltaproteobacteria bacterium]
MQKILKTFLVGYTAILMANSVYAADAPVLKFLFTIDKFYQDKLNTPMGVFVDKGRGEVYLADSGRSEVLIFDLKGNPLFKFGKVHGVSNPFDLVVKNNKIYLAQEDKPYIEVFNYRGEAMARVAPPEGASFSPGRLVLDEDGSIYVIKIRLKPTALSLIARTGLLA